MTKSIAYTPELVASIVSAYEAGTSLEEIAKEAGKTVPMIRSKLVAEKVYVAKGKTLSTETRPSAVRKSTLVAKVSEMLGGDKSLESLEKATKQDLEYLVKTLGEYFGE